MDVKEQVISFKVAKLANLKGFDPDIKLKKNSHYNSNTEELDSLGASGSVVCNHYYASTQSLLQKWIRDLFNIHIEITQWSDLTWSAQLVYDCSDSDENSYEAEDCLTYEEALEIALYEALKVI